MDTTTKTFNFYCPRCDHGTDFKGNLILHLNSKKECTITKENCNKPNISRAEILETLKAPDPKLPQTECQYCKKLVGKANFARHIKTCKDKPDAVVDIQDNVIFNNNTSIEELRKHIHTQDELIMFYRKENEILKNQQVQVTINIINDVPKKNTYKKKNIPHSVKIKSWNTHVGELIPKVKCLCCHNINITQHNFQCGHIVAECNGGSLDIDNLLPICNVCNYSMGSTNMNEFKNTYGLSNGAA